SYVDIAAPGGDMTVDQNGDAYADGVLQNTFNPITGNTSDFGYWFFEGTSMAAPHVSGVAALLISAGASGPDAVRNLLESTAEDKGPAGWDAGYGWGIVDARAALNATLVPNNPPVADANGPYTGTEDIAVTFDGSGSYDPDSDPLTYSWNFGDGNSGSGVSPTHAYTAGGTYTVTLVVNDGRDDSAADTTTVTVTEVNDPPVADAGPNQSGLVGETLTFDGSGSDDPDGTIVSYAWDFGDTGTASGVAVTHAYASAGTYTVTLTVTDNSTATDSDTATVTITEAPPIPTMYVSAVDVALVSRGWGRKVYATAAVSVADEYGSPVGSATVYGHWENATSGSDSSATDSSGSVSFKSDALRLPPSGTTFTFVVDDVVKAGWVYDDSGSVTEGSVSMP
ncbi:MAG: PKD domain-containing protein, partial [Armatimonadetes bacterium]|nr:PKD domain-containing protein [Armatimonadota bacterium]NIM24427.1 PKD domain-containing protein [Armatimonadota bacterium]NIM68298.1 PKD domain-containing protein [Armatimonadota bacterium]NIM76702.1 PKD domain-containing protein [Armatimonadota bacterium]NIN06501.1 PKD domain-containing protein [Armatimonadota bacterium]